MGTGVTFIYSFGLSGSVYPNKYYILLDSIISACLENTLLFLVFYTKFGVQCKCSMIFS